MGEEQEILNIKSVNKPTNWWYKTLVSFKRMIFKETLLAVLYKSIECNGSDYYEDQLPFRACTLLKSVKESRMCY